MRFEELCADPAGTLGRVLDHAGLAAEDVWVRALAGRIRAPRQETILTTQDVEAIRRLTAPVASRLGVEAAAVGALSGTQVERVPSVSYVGPTLAAGP